MTNTMPMTNQHPPLWWCHNERNGVSDHQRIDCLVSRCRSKRTSKLAFVRGIHRWPVNSPPKGPVTRKMFQFDDVIMRGTGSLLLLFCLLIYPWLQAILYLIPYHVLEKTCTTIHIPKLWFYTRYQRSYRGWEKMTNLSRSTPKYNDAIMGTMASQITCSRLFTPRFIEAQIKESIKAPRHWPLCGEFTGDRWIPRTNGQ